MNTAAFELAEYTAPEYGEELFPPSPLERMGKVAREEYWHTLALRHSKGIGVRTQARLLKYFGDAATVCANAANWLDSNVDSARAVEYTSGAWELAAKKEWRKSLASNASIILWKSPYYPAPLRQLPDAPPLLYAFGDFELLKSPCLAIVGTRHPSPHGVKAAANFGYGLSAAGITVVSGLAMGIDREAHIAALSGVGKTIGVLGTGIDIIYPRMNSDVFEAIAQDGLLVSEFPPGAPPVANNFPIRNRIISGLSLGVIVVEAAARSGSLVTARLALEQNREVFAIPGPALEGYSAGCQNLIRQGARPVFFPEDVLRDLAPSLAGFSLPQKAQCLRLPLDNCPKGKKDFKVKTIPPPDIGQGIEDSADRQAVDAAADSLLGNDTPGKILACLKKHGIMGVDAILDATGINSSQLSAALLGLEMTGKIKRKPGAKYEIA